MAKSFWMNDQKGNFSNGGNDTFDETKDYIGIRLQQGVPLLDRDWNELEDIRRYQDWVLREKYLGDGTPDNGFAITLIAGKVDDFNISMGRCLVDGFEAVNRAALTYLKQKDVPPLTIPPANRTDLVYIDLWISEIHGTDDLKNSQDVKIETSARQMIEWRVLVNETGKKLKQETFHHYYVIASMERNGALITSLKDLRTALRINPLFRSLSVSEAGSIGIGTTDPKRMLHVEGSEVHSGGGPTAGFSFANRDAPNNGAYVENGADGLRWVWYARGQAAHLWAGGDKLVVDKNGNISASHGPQKGVKVADNVGLKLNSADGGGVICGFNLDHSIFFRIGQDGAGNVTDYHQFGTHRFFSGGTLETQAERMRITAGGAVGIGTTDPKRTLHVEGSEIHSGSGASGFSFANRDAPNNGDYVNSGADGQRWVWYAAGGTARLWAAGDKLAVDKNGNITISHGPQKAVKVADNVGLKLNSADGGGVIYGFNLDHSIFFRIGQDGAGNVTDYHQFGTHRFFSGGTLETQAERMRITAGGAVGIGTTDPKRTLHVEGSEIHSGSGASGFSFANRDAPNNGDYVNSGADGQRWVWYAAGGTAHLWAGGDKFWVDKDGNVGAVGKIPTSSDLRLKTSIEPLNDVLTRLEKIRAVYFEWNDVYRSLGGCSDRREIGLIAQEVEAVFPEAVMNWGDKGYLGIDYGRFSSILVEAVKELNSIIKGLNERIEHLEKKAAIK